MPEETFDLVVIGAGPGGYVCAIRAAQLGLKVALVDKRATLGGTCLNVGCIPTKALLHSTELYHTLLHDRAAHGIEAEKIGFNLAALMKRKDDVVKKLCAGVGQLVTKRGIKLFTGNGSLLDKGKVAVAGDTPAVLQAKSIVLATGSVPTPLPSLPFDGVNVLSSDQAIALDRVPKRMLVVGGGAIGLELSSVWARLGSEVTVVEFAPQIAPSCDADIAKMLERSLKKQGITCETSTAVRDAGKVAEGIRVLARKGDQDRGYTVDKVLVAVGRSAFTAGLGLERLGLSPDERGRVRVNHRFETTVEGLYAIGDVIGGAMLAHKAEDEGMALAELLAGKAGHVNYATIPAVIYTSPEVATVGLGEDAAKKQGLEVRVGKFALAANGRALAMDATEGFAKVIACAKTDTLLGVQILAHGASELIGSAVAHMEYGGSSEDMARTCAAHPTLSEVLKEAALAVEKRAIHAL